MEYTEGEWKATDYVMVDGKRRYDVETADEVIAMDVSQANAERIVKAVNCHDDLVEALKFFMNQLEPWEKLYPGLKQWTLLAKETGAKTLSKAEAL